MLNDTIQMGLDDALEYIADDELVEVGTRLLHCNTNVPSHYRGIHEIRRSQVALSAHAPNAELA